MGLSKEEAIQMIGAYLTPKLNVADLIDGWPAGVYRSSDESAVWSMRMPPEQSRVGGDRFIVLSKITGKILADQEVGG